MESPKLFYVYILSDQAENGTNVPFYVGKGTGRRMFNHKSMALKKKDGVYVLNHPLYIKIREMISTGKMVRMEQVLINVTEAEALVHEKKLIKQYGRICESTGTLTNIHKGGARPSGTTCKPVCQYSLEGAFIAEYPSAKIAAELVSEANSSYITQCVKGKRVSSGGFLWTYKGELPKEYTKQYWRAVNQNTVDGQLVARYKSLTEAEKATGVEKHNISEACRGNSKTAGGWIWQYCN